jgi:integrase
VKRIGKGAILSEVLHAKWERIDFVNASWLIPSTMSGKPQTIPLLSDVLTKLQELPRDSVYVIARKMKDHHFEISNTTMHDLFCPAP